MSPVPGAGWGYGFSACSRHFSRRHHHKPYAGGMLPAFFPVATMAATYTVHCGIALQ
jgi:predicted hotdog family 3-hydroxylacyl-ACP dehydratase